MSKPIEQPFDVQTIIPIAHEISILVQTRNVTTGTWNDRLRDTIAYLGREGYVRENRLQLECEQYRDGEPTGVSMTFECEIRREIVLKMNSTIAEVL